MDEDVLAFTDRTHQWNGATVAGMPSYLIGQDYIRLPNDDRSVSDFQLSIDLAVDSTIYVLLDNRVSVRPWMTAAGFIDTGEEVGVDEGGGGVGPGVSIENRSSIFRLDVPAGTTVLGEQNLGGTNMYGVVAARQDPREFSVYFDIGPENQQVQSGHIGVPDPTDLATPNNGNNGPEISGYTVYAGTSTIDVSINDTDQYGADVGAIDWRDRGDSTNAGADLVQLAEDFVKNNSGIVRVTLDGLDAGFYDITSFHVDPDNNQSGEIHVWLNTGSGFYDTGAVGNSNFSNGGVNGLTTQEVLDSAAYFSFELLEPGSVDIVFDGRPHSDNETPLNGLHIVFEPLPEPTSLALLGLGALALRRRRK